MEKLTGNTAGTLKKMWPPVKRKAVEQHPSFGPFVGMTSEGEAAKPAAAPKANGGRKRKAAQADSENNSVDGNTGVAADKAKPKKQAPKKAKKGKDDAGAEEADGTFVCLVVTPNINDASRKRGEQRRGYR